MDGVCSFSKTLGFVLPGYILIRSAASVFQKVVDVILDVQFVVVLGAGGGAEGRGGLVLFGNLVDLVDTHTFWAFGSFAAEVTGVFVADTHLLDITQSLLFAHWLMFYYLYLANLILVTLSAIVLGSCILWF